MYNRIFQLFAYLSSRDGTKRSNRFVKEYDEYCTPKPPLLRRDETLALPSRLRHPGEVHRNQRGRAHVSLASTLSPHLISSRWGGRSKS